MHKAAIVGTGGVAEMHARALTALGIPIVAVVGTRPEKAAHFAQKFGIPQLGTEPSLLEKADCIHICTPPAAHGDLIRYLLERDKQILCEKPFVLDPREGEALAALAVSKNRICAVGFNLRFYPAVQKMRELVLDPAFGSLLLVHGSYLQEFGAEPAEYSWRYTDPMHAMTEIGSHWLDLAEFVTGREVLSLSAQFDRFQPLRYQKNGLLYLSEVQEAQPVRIESEDSAVLSLRFSGGAIGAAVFSEIAHGRGNRLTLEVTGTKRSLWWNSEQPDVLHIAEKGKIEVLHLGGDFVQTFIDEIKFFYASVDGNDATVSPGADFGQGSHNVLLCQLAKESADRQGQWMEVPR